MSTIDPRSLAALSFDSPIRAGEFLTTVARLEAEGNVLVHDAVFVSANLDGKVSVQETTDLSAGDGAVSGAIWGGLFGLILLAPIAGLALGAAGGALAGRLTDRGVSKEFVDEMREAVQPGKTILVLLVSHMNRDALRTDLSRFEGVELVSTDIDMEAFDVARQHLAEPQRV